MNDKSIHKKVCAFIFIIVMLPIKINIVYNSTRLEKVIKMLKISNLTKYYGKNLGVENVSLEINDGEIFGFIGPNGAGKSTTIKCVLNFLNKDNGKILFDGKKIDDEAKKYIGYLPAEVNLYDNMTVKDMFKYSNTFYDIDCTKKVNKLVKKLELDINKKIDELSLGNLKKVGIILALMHNPKLIILDEPTSGLDPLMQEAFFEIMLEEKKNGNTIFFSSHNLSEVKRICDRVAIIRKGKIIKQDTIDNISENNFIKIKVFAKDIKKIKFPVKDMKINELTDDYIDFVYQGDINKVIEKISGVSINKLLIEEPTLEEIFMHYYKEV